MISAIVATDENGIIGNNGKIPWHLPADLKFFKEKTLGSTVIMGRKTFDSIGKALPDRNNIVVTRNKNFSARGVNIVIDSVEMAINFATSISDNVFIIGGGQIYQQSMPYWDELYWTKVHCNVDGDTMFPQINAQDWNLIKSEHFKKDDSNNMDFTISLFKKK